MWYHVKVRHAGVVAPLVVAFFACASGCYQVDCLSFPRVDKVGISEDGFSYWITGFEGRVGAPPCNVQRTELILDKDLLPDVSSYAWSIDESVPQIPIGFDEISEGDLLQCNRCELIFSAQNSCCDLHLAVADDDSFIVELVDLKGNVLSSGSI